MDGFLNLLFSRGRVDVFFDHKDIYHKKVGDLELSHAFWSSQAKVSVKIIIWKLNGRPEKAVVHGFEAKRSNIGLGSEWAFDRKRVSKIAT